MVYGLVAPGYAMAEVVADRLLGGAAEFPGADMSTKLKLLGVDVASFGDAHAHDRGRARGRAQRRGRRHVQRSSWSPTTRSTLLGGVLVGDASAYPMLRPLVGRELPGDPAALIAPGGARGSASARCRTTRRSARATR